MHLIGKDSEYVTKLKVKPLNINCETHWTVSEVMHENSLPVFELPTCRSVQPQNQTHVRTFLTGKGRTNMYSRSSDITSTNRQFIMKGTQQDNNRIFPQQGHNITCNLLLKFTPCQMQWSHCHNPPPMPNMSLWTSWSSLLGMAEV